jgi:hypothetical protein
MKPHPIPSFRSFSFLVCSLLCVLTPKFSFAHSFDGGSDIVAVSAEGHLTLSDGQNVALWGLKITDIAAFEQLLSGKKILCATVIAVNDLAYSSCVLRVEDHNNLYRSNLLDLYAWLPEFGYAEYACNGDIPPDWQSDGIKQIPIDGILYGCSANGSPLRSHIYQ